MDIVPAKGASFYQSGAITLMQAYTVTDVVGTQQRYQAAVADAADKMCIRDRDNAFHGV